MTKKKRKEHKTKPNETQQAKKERKKETCFLSLAKSSSFPCYLQRQKSQSVRHPLSSVHWWGTAVPPWANLQPLTAKWLATPSQRSTGKRWRVITWPPEEPFHYSEDSSLLNTHWGMFTWHREVIFIIMQYIVRNHYMNYIQASLHDVDWGIVTGHALCNCYSVSHWETTYLFCPACGPSFWFN